MIGKPIDLGPPVGLILKPTATNIRCLFPADAATDSRDGDGCGPLVNDAHYGSKGYDHASWFRKQLLKANVIYYKNAVFGANRTFESIPCDEFYMPNADFNGTQPPRYASVIGQMSKHLEWEFQSLDEYQIDQW